MMHQQKQGGITVFFSYAQNDQAVHDQLAAHLSQLKRDGLIEEWSDQQIPAGEDRAQAIDQALHSAQIILLLISADFLASDACYEIEMQQALERDQRGEARVIPVIVRPCDWQDSPFAHLQCLPRNKKPIVKWRNRDEAFLTIVKELRLLIAQQQHPPTTLSYRPQTNRARMLRRVRSIWVTGLSDRSSHQAAWIDLNLQDQPDALADPLRREVQGLNILPRSLPPGTSIARVYDEANGRLLILGEAGAGKTTLLLHLAQTLLDRAETNENYPIPVVFTLSSWARQRRPLEHWLVEELNNIYQVPPEIAKQWIEANQIFPLLDGLDEVAAEARPACIEEITKYCSQHSSQTVTSLVVCCRNEEYQALPSRLQLDGAVSIEPLTDEQIEAYLSSQGQLEGLRQALSDNVELKEFARHPLMLRVLTLEHQWTSSAELPADSAREQTFHAIFERYITRMLTQWRPLERETQVRFLARLTYLAKHLRRQQQTVLLVEDLQPDWLPVKHQRLYHWSLGLLALLFFGLLFGLFVGLQNRLNSGLGLGVGLSFGVFGGLGFEILAGLCVWQFGGLFSQQDEDRIRPAEAISWSWKGVWKVLASQLGNGLSVGLDFVLIAWLFIGLFNGLFNVWPVALLLSALASVSVSLLISGLVGRVIKPAERVRPASASRPWKKVLGVLNVVLTIGGPLVLLELLIKLLDWQRAGLFNGLIPLLPVGLLSELGVGSLVGLSVGLGVGLGSGLIKGLRSGLSMKQLQLTERDRFPPNQGIWRSGQNGLLIGLLVGLIDALLVGSVAALLFAQLGFPQSAVLGLFVGLLFGGGVASFVGLLYGLNAFAQHFTLRFWLWRANCLPRNLIAFLDEAVERLSLLVRKSGGSYIFHQRLLDYFASLGEPIPVKSVSPNRDRSFTRRVVASLLVLTLIGAAMSLLVAAFLNIPHLTPRSTSFTALSTSPIAHVGSVKPGSLIVNNGVFYFTTIADNGIYLHALDAASGKQMWTYHSLGQTNLEPFEPSIVVVNGTVYFATFASKTGAASLHAFDAVSGAQKWVWTSAFSFVLPYFRVNSGSVYFITIVASPKDPKVFGFDTYLYALNAASGVQKWAYHVSSFYLSHSESPSQLSSQVLSLLYSVVGELLAVDKDTLYFASYDSGGIDLHALNAASGAQKWIYHVSGSLHWLWDDFVVDNGIVYFVTQNVDYNLIIRLISGNSNSGVSTFLRSGNTSIYALDAATGVQKWTYRASGPIELDLGVNRGVVYFESIESNQIYFYALDAALGKQMWTYHSSSLAFLPMVDNGIVYLGNDNVRTKNADLQAIDITSGKQKWTYHLLGLLPVSTPPPVDHGTIYFDALNSSGTDIYAFDAASGVQKWTAHVYAVPNAQPTINKGLVYFFATGTDKAVYLYSLTAASGVQKWVVHPSGSFNPSFFVFNVTLDPLVRSLLAGTSLLTSFGPTIDSDTVYIATSGNADNTDTYLYALDATSGAQKWGYFVYS